MLRNHSEMQCIMTEVTNNGIKPVTNIGIHITSNRVLFRLLSSSKDNQMAIRILTKYINTTTYIYRSKKQHKTRIRDNCLCELCTGTATQNEKQPLSSKKNSTSGRYTVQEMRDFMHKAQQASPTSSHSSPTSSHSRSRSTSRTSYGSTRSSGSRYRYTDDAPSDPRDDDTRRCTHKCHSAFECKVHKITGCDLVCDAVLVYVCDICDTPGTKGNDCTNKFENFTCRGRIRKQACPNRVYHNFEGSRY